MYVKHEFRRNYEERGIAGQSGNDVLRDPVREELLLRVAAHIGERQHCNRRLVRQRQWLAQAGRQVLDGDAAVPNPVRTHWPGDVLYLLLAHVLERVIEPVAHLIAHDPADADPAGLGQGFQARGDIHPIAEDIVLLSDHVAEIDADAEVDAAVFSHAGIAFGHPTLHLDRAAHRAYYARELSQQSVAGVLYGSASVFIDPRINQLPEMRLEPRVRALLVRAHQTRVPGHIGGEDRGQAPLDTFLRHCPVPNCRVTAYYVRASAEALSQASAIVATVRPREANLNARDSDTVLSSRAARMKRDRKGRGSTCRAQRKFETGGA